MPEQKSAKPEVEALAAKFDQLMYMIKTTAPHLQMLAVELRDLMQKALATGYASAASK